MSSGVTADIRRPDFIPFARDHFILRPPPGMPRFKAIRGIKRHLDPSFPNRENQLMLHLYNTQIRAIQACLNRPLKQ